MFERSSQAVAVKVELNREVGRELQSKLGHLLLETMTRRWSVLAPEVLQQLGPGHDRPRSGGKRGEDVDALWGEVDFRAIVREQGHFAEHRESDSRRAFAVHRIVTVMLAVAALTAIYRPSGIGWAYETTPARDIRRFQRPSRVLCALLGARYGLLVAVAVAVGVWVGVPVWVGVRGTVHQLCPGEILEIPLT